MIKSDPNLIRLLRLICSEFSNKIIMGDLNADVVSDSNSDTKYIRYLMYELSLKLVNTCQAHHSSSRDTWIDILLVDQCKTVIESNRVPSPILSRHGIISIKIKKNFSYHSIVYCDV